MYCCSCVLTNQPGTNSPHEAGPPPGLSLMTVPGFISVRTSLCARPVSVPKSEKLIETLFSQLCDQFIIRRNYTKSFAGVVVRILSKIAAFTCAQYVNTFINHKSVNHVKYAW